MDDRVAAAALGALAASTNEPVWIVDDGGRLVLANAAFREQCERFLGVKPGLGQQLEQLVPRRRRLVTRFWIDLLRRALSGRTVNAEATYRIEGGKRRFSVTATPIQQDGAVHGAIFTVRDITDYRRPAPHEFLELALARIFTEDVAGDPMPRLLEAFCESIGWDFGVSWVVDEQHLRVEAIWHKPHFHAEPILDVLHGATFGAGSGIPGRVWRSGEPMAVSDLWEETGARRAIGVHASGLHGVVAFPILSSSGTVQRVLEFFARRATQVDTGLLETLRHVGREVGRFIERKQAELERAALQELLVKKGREWSMTFDAIDSPIFIVDAHGSVTRLNRAARDLAQARYFQDILGHTIGSLGEKEHWGTLMHLAQRVRESGRAADAQITDGRRRWDVNATIAPAGNESRVVLFMRDVTTLIDLQETLRRSEQLSAMGELVAGVAHEVRNPLFGMMATLDAWELFKDDPTEAAELIPILRKWLDRLNTLMERLLDYGKVTDMIMTDTPIDQVISAAIDSCMPLAQQERITIVRDMPPDAPLVHVDTSRIVQAFENLILNAIQHSPAGGTIRICVRKQEAALECAVVDSGPGFAPDDITRVFQPFFTRRRGGTGLGLSIVSRVVEEHGGTITAGNADQGGAEVTLVLPIPRANEHAISSS